MEVQAALVGQYRAGLAMLRDCLEKCPDDLWTAGTHPRNFWRTAYHALFYTHFYLMPDPDSFTPWEKHVLHARITWDDDEDGIPPLIEPYAREELISYLERIYQSVGEWVDALDLESETSGFHWYPIPKLEHQIVNIRHLGVHVGQLQELLMDRNIDPIWAGKR